jgi:hypothetical protein
MTNEFESGAADADCGYADIGCAKIDTSRAERQGFAEVVFCQGKHTAHLQAIYQRIYEAEGRVLGTRATADQAAAVREVLPQAQYDEVSRILKVEGAGAAGAPGAQAGAGAKFAGGECVTCVPAAAAGTGAGAGAGTGAPASDTFATTSAKSAPGLGKVVVCCAGTSDLPVAEEAAQTAEFFGSRVVRLYDVGVSGLHRLTANAGALDGASCVIAVAGMEGALPSVLGGLARVPVIAVPTSVGYGASFGGLAALLAMLNTCANGVTVVNIDNGYGAAYVATQINRQTFAPHTQ